LQALRGLAASRGANARESTIVVYHDGWHRAAAPVIEVDFTEGSEEMTQIQKYPASWRLLHWLMALMVLVTIPIGLWMASRAEANIWGALTDTLYNWHKAIGFSVLLLMILRIGMKAVLKGPPYPETLPRKLQVAAKSLHHLLYILLVVTPLFGWAGVTAFPALVTLGGYHLPAMPFVPEDRELSDRLFAIHGVLAVTLGVLIVGHIAAAMRHMLKKDGIFRRML
jgi:cytochrome b561